jgi:hypothetical protein
MTYNPKSNVSTCHTIFFREQFLRKILHLCSTVTTIFHKWLIGSTDRPCGYVGLCRTPDMSHSLFTYSLLFTLQRLPPLGAFSCFPARQENWTWGCREIPAGGDGTPRIPPLNSPCPMVSAQECALGGGQLCKGSASSNCQERPGCHPRQ